MFQKILVITGGLLLSIGAISQAAEAPNTEDYLFSFEHVRPSYDAQALVYFVLNSNRPVLENYFPGFREHRDFVCHYIQLLTSNHATTLEKIVTDLLKDLLAYTDDVRVLLLEAFLLTCSKLGLLNKDLITSIKICAFLGGQQYVIDFLLRYRNASNTTAAPESQTGTHTSLLARLAALQQQQITSSELFSLGAY